MFGSAELFGPTSIVGFGPNDRTFFCRNRTFFFVLHSMPMASFHIFVFLMTHMYMALSLVLIGEIAKRMPTEPKLE